MKELARRLGVVAAQGHVQILAVGDNPVHTEIAVCARIRKPEQRRGDLGLGQLCAVKAVDAQIGFLLVDRNRFAVDLLLADYAVFVHDGGKPLRHDRRGGKVDRVAAAGRQTGVHRHRIAAVKSAEGDGLRRGVVILVHGDGAVGIARL